MDWSHDLIDRLAHSVPGGYAERGEATTEPTALAGLALVAHSRIAAAQIAAHWLAEQQADAGSVGISPQRATPCWPTALAILLWRAVDRATGTGTHLRAVDRAIQWALAERGRIQRRGPLTGHDSTLVGWSWAANTHSWLEPTSMFVLALKAAGHANHPRTGEAVRLIVDRQLPTGGCNYGNTIILDQVLLPHVQPTGLAMMALADEKIDDARIELSLRYLERELCRETTTASLCYGLLGLAAHGCTPPPDRLVWLRRAYERVVHRSVNAYKLALLALASSDRYPFGAPVQGAKNA